MKKLFKSKKGLTYVELLVAFTLLVLIIMMFSPMMLNAYNSLYKAGEINENTYKAKTVIETRLSQRMDDSIINNNSGLQINLDGFTGQLLLKARRVASDVSELETIYRVGAGAIKIVSSSAVSDNQQSQYVRMRLVNFTPLTYITCDAVPTEAEQQETGKLRFYVVSEITGEVHTGCTATGEFPYCNLVIPDIDITDSPIIIRAYYVDTYGSPQVLEERLFISPADVMMVGKSGDNNQYYTSAGVVNDNLYIAGRKMNDAPISTGTVMNDVTWVSAAEDSTFDGYYMMCGENSTVRRLWHLNDTTSSSFPELDYKVEDAKVILGQTYYKYKWAYDYADIYGYSAKKSGQDSSYTSSDSTKQNVYCDGSGDGKTISFAFSFNGYTAGYDNVGSRLRRISYVLKSTLEEANAAGYTYRKGYYSARSKPASDVSVQGYNVSTSGNNKQRACLYCPEDDTWYYVNDWKTVFFVPTAIKSVTSTGIKGYNNWVDGDKYYSMGDDATGDGFFCRDTYGCKNETPVDWVNDSAFLNEKSRAYDKVYACLVLKAYNNISDSYLNDSYLAATPSRTVNKVSLSACCALPGKSQCLYVGTTNAYAFINQTDATESQITDTRANGTFTGYAIKGNKLINSTMYTFSQKQDYSDFSSWGTSYGGTNPDSGFIRTQYFTNKSGADKVETSDLCFTLGYASALSLTYDQFAINDLKPLEKFYQSSKGLSSISGDELKNMWLTREFYNLTASENFNESVICVGYNVSGYVKKQFQYCYTTLGKNYDWTEIEKHHSSDWVFTPPKPSSGGGDGWGQSYSTTGKTYLYWNSEWIKGDPYWVIIPRTIVGSTALDKLTNDGVLSVYNAGDASFTNIYYYKDPNHNSIRFNCVSATAGENNQVWAAIGASDGSVFLAKMDYVNGKIVTTSLTASTCPLVCNTGLASVESIKIYNEGVKTYIIAGGKASGASGNIAVIELTSDGKLSGTVKTVTVSGSSVNDIALANGYLLAVSNSGDQGYVSFVAADSPAGTWKTVDSYYTDFSVDASGKFKPSGSSAKLTALNSIDTKYER